MKLEKEYWRKSTELPKKFQENYPEANSGYEKLIEKVFGSQTIEAKEKNLSKLDRLVLATEIANEDVCALRDFILDDLKSCSKGGENYKLAERISKKYLAWSAAHLEMMKELEDDMKKGIHNAKTLGYAFEIDNSGKINLKVNTKELLRECLIGSSNSIKAQYIMSIIIQSFVQELKLLGKKDEKFLEMAICYEEAFIKNKKVTERVIEDTCIKMGYSASSRNVFYRRKEDAIQMLAEILFCGRL